MTQGNLFGVEYHCISADIPWPETGGGKIRRGCTRHYPVIKKKEDIVKVMIEAPCWRPADDCHLWLWVTNSFLEWGLWVMKELGFRYISNRAWAKMEELNVDEAGCFGPSLPNSRYRSPVYVKQNHGLGQYMFGLHELLLFGTRGKAMLPPTKGRPETLLCAPRTKQHSEKPSQAYADMEFVSPGPRLEMFARNPREGWTVWGLEADGSRVISEEAKRSGR